MVDHFRACLDHACSCPALLSGSPSGSLLDYALLGKLLVKIMPYAYPEGKGKDQRIAGHGRLGDVTNFL